MAITPQDPHKAIITSVGSATGGGTANSAKPLVTGTADAGTTVDIFDGVRLIGTAIVASNGTWSFAPAADLKAGAHSFTAISVNSNGDYGASSTPMSVTVPGTPVAPAKPIITGLTDDSNSPIASGGGTVDAHPHINGTGIAGDIIKVYEGSTVIGSTSIGGDGTWRFTPSSDLTAGPHSITVAEVNAAGTPSANSDPISVTILTVPAAPAAPAIVDDTGANIPAGGATNVSTPHISGTGHAGDTITAFDGVATLGTATVGADGKWTFTPTPLSGGSHSISVTETNAAGTSVHSAAVGFTTSVPVVTITGLYDNNHSLIAQNGSTTGPITIEGTASGYADGDQVSLFFEGSASNLGYARGQIYISIVGGKFSATVDQSTLADQKTGGHPLFGATGSIVVTGLLVHAADGSGAVYAHSDTYTITDTNWLARNIPAAPVLTDDAGANIPAGGATSVATPHISGTGQTGTTIMVFDGATVIGSTTVGADGKWSIAPSPLSSGSHSISVTENTVAGTSAHSTAISFTTSPVIVAITGLYDHNHNLIAQNGSTTGPVTIEGTASGYADGDLIGLYFTGSATTFSFTRCEIFVTVVGGKFSATVSQNTKTDPSFGGGLIFEGPGNFTVSAFLMHADTNKVFASSAGYTVTDTNWTVAGVQAVLTQTDNNGDHSLSVAVGDTDQPAQQTSHHTVVGEHDAFIGKAANGNETVDLNADPSTYFKEATAHIQGGGGTAIDTLHLLGDHQVLDLTSLTGKTAAAKISGIEVVDLGGQHNTLKLSLMDVLNLGETDLFQTDGKQQMMVQGKDGDMVDLSNTHIAGLTDGEWAVHGTTQVGGVTYNVYEHSGVHTELLVQQGVQIVVH